jgi:hypothetical protein
MPSLSSRERVTFVPFTEFPKSKSSRGVHHALFFFGSPYQIYKAY